MAASAAEIRSTVEELGLKPAPNSPLRAALAEATNQGTAPAGNDLKAWKSSRNILESLCNPTCFARLTMPGVRSSTRLTFFADKAGSDFIGFWPENGAWQFAPRMSPDDILQIADDALGLRGEEDVEQVTNQLSADALFALAAAVDAIRFRYLGEWIYRQLPSDQPFTLQELNEQLRLGLENIDPRWSVAMAAALLPAGTFSIATDLAGGLSQLAAAGGFVEYADNERTQWRPGDRLQELAAEWLAPISALMLESVATDKAGSAIARDCCALVRGQGPLTLLDFGKAVRGEPAAKIATGRVAPEEAYKRLLSGLMTPEPVSAAAKQTVANAKVDRDAAAEAHTGLGAREQQASKPGEAVAASAAVAATGSRPSGSERSNAVETAPQRKFCAACGTPVRPEARFCHQCGNAY